METRGFSKDTVEKTVVGEALLCVGGACHSLYQCEFTQQYS
jgi:hypothetical protein